MSSFDADVIVIGGGPAGVAAAIELRRQGVDQVVLLDREAQLGGATRHCSHSPFGMREFGRVYFGAAYGQRLEREAQRAGIDVRMGHSVAQLGDGGEIKVTSAAGVSNLRGRRILLATGARERSRSSQLVPGDRPLGIVTTGALQAFVAFHGLMPFRRPLIVGSELVSLSAVMTCLTHGARPVAVIEQNPQALVRAPLGLFPAMMGIPMLRDTTIIDILGRSRVQQVVVGQGENHRTFDCDGVLFTGRFMPEAALILQYGIALDQGSFGPAIDQHGRTRNPGIFAAGNVLRAIETGGWCFREGRAIAASLAVDLRNDPDCSTPLVVTHDDPIKLVTPSLLRAAGPGRRALDHFQLRFQRRARGTLSLNIDGRPVWNRAGAWYPERRVLVPMPGEAQDASQVHFSFSLDD